jgi:1-acyl-sn-glycerol-3-phosphate acyltransferase
VFYWLLKFVFLGPLLKMVFRPRVEGAENVPEDGSTTWSSAERNSRIGWVTFGRSARTCFQPVIIECAARSGVRP